MTSDNHAVYTIRLLRLCTMLNIDSSQFIQDKLNMSRTAYARMTKDLKNKIYVTHQTFNKIYRLVLDRLPEDIMLSREELESFLAGATDILLGYKFPTIREEMRILEEMEKKAANR